MDSVLVVPVDRLADSVPLVLVDRPADSVPVAQAAVALVAMAVEQVAVVGVAEVAMAVEVVEAGAKAAALHRRALRTRTARRDVDPAVAIKKESLATSDAPKSPACAVPEPPPTPAPTTAPTSTTAEPPRLQRVPRRVWRSECRAARALVREWLANGPKLESLVDAAAEAAWSYSTINRLKARLADEAI